MGQIVQKANNPVRCNLAAIQSGGSKAGTVLASGEIWLVDTTNASKGSKGYGKYDAYIKGDGVTAASGLDVVMIDAEAFAAIESLRSSTSLGIQTAMAAVSAEQQRATQVENTKYSKPAGGIPKVDLASDVRNALDLATDVVYDISAHNNNTAYADLAAALGTGGANVPQSLRKGGMSIKYVQSSDNKYVQYRYMESDAATAATFTNPNNWEIYESYDAPQATKDVRNVYGIRDIVANFPIGENDTFSLRAYYNRDISGGNSQAFTIRATLGGDTYVFSYSAEDLVKRTDTQYLKIPSVQDANKILYITLTWRTDINSTLDIALDRNFIVYNPHDDINALSASTSSKFSAIENDNNGYFLFTEHKYYVASSGAAGASNSFDSSVLFPIEEGAKIKYRLLVPDVYASILYYDASKQFISGIGVAGSPNAMQETTVPAGHGVKYVRFSTQNGSGVNPYVAIGNTSLALLVAEDKLDAVKAYTDTTVNNAVTPIKSDSNAYPLFTEHKYYVASSGASGNDNTYSSSGLFSIEEGVKIRYNLYTPSSYAVILFYDDNREFVSAIAGSSRDALETTVPTNQGIKYVRFSTLNNDSQLPNPYVYFGGSPLSDMLLAEKEKELSDSLMAEINTKSAPIYRKYIDPLAGIHFGTGANDTAFKNAIKGIWLLSYGYDLSDFPSSFYLKYFGRESSRTIISFYYNDGGTEKQVFGNYYSTTRKTGREIEVMNGRNGFEGLVLMCDIDWSAIDSYITSGLSTTVTLSELNANETQEFDYDDMSENISLVSNIDWRGKHIVVFGDSLTEFGGLYFKNNLNKYIGYYKRYSDYIEQITGAKLHNIAIGGSQFRQRTTPVLTPTSNSEAYAGLDIINMVKACCNVMFDETHSYKDVAQNAAQYIVTNNDADNNLSVITEMLNIDWTAVDGVIVNGGSNDWNSYNNWGTSGSSDIGTTLGAINEIIRLLLTTYPKLKIYWATPIVSWENYPATQNIEDYSDNVTKGGKTKPEYVQMLVDEVSKYHLPVCNLYETLGWNQYNFSQYFTGNDGTHPIGGFKEIARRLVGFINGYRTF